MDGRGRGGRLRGPAPNRERRSGLPLRPRRRRARRSRRRLGPPEEARTLGKDRGVKDYRAPNHISKTVLSTVHLGPHPLTEERTFQLRFEISRPEPKKKPRKVRKPKPRKPRARKPRVPTRTAEEQIEARQEYDKARSQTPERKEAGRLRVRQVRLERKEAGQCRDCSNEAIPGQTKCESCRDKHNRNR